MSHHNPEEINLSDTEDFYFDPNPQASPNEDFDIADDPSLAATLGFTSFGGTKHTNDDDDGAPHPISKKRRYNPQYDNAVVDFAQPSLAARRASTNEVTYEDKDQGHGIGMNPTWYIEYYDPSSNENPWEGMEKFKGLEPHKGIT
ncbi:hypothetical protein N0V88_000093 [Collariella sp. IMI 366227]|nr:hypothetical protein N0V88_000093 [Collariella sp. IMI 366227]